MRVALFFILLPIINCSPIIGIDFGTTKITASIIDTTINQSHDAQTLQDSIITFSIPSIVALTNDGPLVGEEALLKQQTKQYKFSSESITIAKNIKQFIDMSYDDEALQEYLQASQFPIETSSYELLFQVYTYCRKSLYTPLDLATLLFEKVKYLAQQKLGDQKANFKVALAIPSNYNYDSKQILKRACEDAGMKLIKEVSEPQAALTAYEKEINELKSNKFAVFDLGYQSLRVHVGSVSGENNFELQSTKIDETVSAKSFNKLIKNYFQFGWQMNQNWYFQDYEQLKMEILFMNQSDPNDGIAFNRKTDRNVVESDTPQLTVDQFQSMSANNYQKSIILLRKALKHAHISKRDLKYMVLVGGSTQLPGLYDYIYKFFNNDITLLDFKGIDSIIAIGAALQGATYVNNTLLLEQGIGIEVQGRKMSRIVNENQPLPNSNEKEYHFYCGKGQESMKIRIYRGNSDYVEDNQFLEETQISCNDNKGEFKNIRVEVSVNESDDIEASIIDLDLNKSENLRITGEEIQQMEQRATKNNDVNEDDQIFIEEIQEEEMQ